MNTSINLLKTSFYVCPNCSNHLTSAKPEPVTCCDQTLLPLVPLPSESAPEIQVERIEMDYYLTVDHPMTKQDSVYFLACLTSDTIQLKKLYPQGSADARFAIRGSGLVVGYCNCHGFFQQKV